MMEVRTGKCSRGSGFGRQDQVGSLGSIREYSWLLSRGKLNAMLQTPMHWTVSAQGDHALAPCVTAGVRTDSHKELVEKWSPVPDLQHWLIRQLHCVFKILKSPDEFVIARQSATAESSFYQRLHSQHLPQWLGKHVRLSTRSQQRVPQNRIRVFTPTNDPHGFDGILYTPNQSLMHHHFPSASYILSMF